VLTEVAASMMATACLSSISREPFIYQPWIHIFHFELPLRRTLNLESSMVKVTSFTASAGFGGWTANLRWICGESTACDHHNVT